MSILSWFTSGSKAAEKTLDASIRGLDALVFTKEERAELNKKLGDNWLELQKVLANENTVRSITRRVLAFGVFGTEISFVLGSAITYGVGNMDYAKFLLDLANGTFGTLTLVVAGFYFGPHMIGRAIGKK